MTYDDETTATSMTVKNYFNVDKTFYMPWGFWVWLEHKTIELLTNAVQAFFEFPRAVKRFFKLAWQETNK